MCPLVTVTEVKEINHILNRRLNHQEGVQTHCTLDYYSALVRSNKSENEQEVKVKVEFMHICMNDSRQV